MAGQAHVDRREMMGRMEGNGGSVERELLDLLWRLMHEREEMHELDTDALDQVDLQIVRCLALLALVRNPPASDAEGQTTP